MESAVSDVYVNNDVNNGHFGYIAHVAGDIFSAIPVSVKRIAAVGGLVGLLYLGVACSSPVQNPSIPSTPTPAISQRTQTDRLTELTVQELISQVRANPNKYKSHTPIRVSGVVTEKVHDIGYRSLFLGPSTKDYSVVVIWDAYANNWEMIMRARVGDSLVIDTVYDVLFGNDYIRNRNEKLIQLNQRNFKK